MQSHRERLALLDRQVTGSVEMGIGQLAAEDEVSDGRHVRIRGRDLLNFASCSYLGLEMDVRLKEAAIEAVRNHGIETSSSRIYLSSPLYTEFEELIEQVFDAHVVVAPTTTLGHFSALPALVDEEDAIIMDHQVHTSVQMACSFAKSAGAHLEVAPHNNMEYLEERIVELSRCHSQVWYMADGIYSMFGDFAPTVEIMAMLDRNPQMRFYVDDAHGMSWTGLHGSGSVLASVDFHPRMVLATGLAKGFGTGGGLIVTPDAEQKRRIRSCGPTLLFCGPIQPPILGAAIASAKIHLSDEIETLQADLRDRMDFCNAQFAEVRLPVISSPDTPVGFVGTGPTRVCRNLCVRMMEEGFYTNPAQFPAAPVRRSGGRFLLTNHHQREDIEALVSAFARHWEPAIRDAGSTPEDVYASFGLEMPVARNTPKAKQEDLSLHLEVVDSIEKLDLEEWDALLGERGCVGSSAMLLYESVFGQHEGAENHWDFRYYVIRDETGSVVLATCFTSALWKADMLASAAVSEEVEKRRENDPRYLTQQVFSMGCLLSEGDHLWLRDTPSSQVGRASLRLLLDAVRRDADRLDCQIRIVRDVPNDSVGLATLLEEEGLIRMDAPESLTLEDVLSTEADLLATLPAHHRYHQKRRVRPFDNSYRVEVVEQGGRAFRAGEVDALYALYENVKNHSFELNTYALPKRLLAQIGDSRDWEVLVFWPTSATPGSDPVGFVAAYVQAGAYVPLFAGLDYGYVRESGLYRQVIRHSVIRAREIGRRRVLFGFSASLEKRRFGALPSASSMFVEADEHYAFDALAQIASSVA